MDRSHKLDTSSSRPGNNSRCYENDGVTMIVPPVTVMRLVPMTAERFVMTDVILFVAPLFAMGVFRRFGLLPLRSGLWITVCDVPLRIYRRESLIVSPESPVFTHLLQCARFSFTCR